MTNQKLDKQVVMAQCVLIMKRQMRSIQNPRLRAALDNAIDYFDYPGRVQQYGMIIYSNAIKLVHNDYQSHPNLCLYPQGKLWISRLDASLDFHDDMCIHINGDGTADAGKCIHGVMTGEVITDKIEYNRGKEVKYRYKSTYTDTSSRPTVNNDYSRGLFARLLRNQTIGRKDFLLGMLMLFGVSYLCMIANIVTTKINETLGLVIMTTLSICCFIVAVRLIYKRVGDLAFFGTSRIIATIVVLACPMLIFALLVFDTKVMSPDQAAAEQDQTRRNLSQAQSLLSRRCDVYDTTPGWFTVSSEALRTATSGTSNFTRNDNTYDPPHEQIQDTSDERQYRESIYRQKQEQIRRDQEAKELRRKELSNSINVLRSELSDHNYRYNEATRQAQNAIQQAETYRSYARSTNDDSLRISYEQSADSYLSEARSAESKASDEASRINSIQQKISSLESEYYSL